MNIKSVKFIGSFIGTEEILSDEIPKIALIGRSNVGKSSLINALTHSGISRTSALPGATQQVNVFLVNNSIHFIDLPGYGYAKGSIGFRTKMRDIIKTYLLNPNFKQKKVVLIIDANVGMTARDESMFAELKKAHKNIVIVASKTDKMTQSEYHKKISELQEMAGNYPVFPVSSTEKTGLDPLTEELLAE
jgi:GTP-binding protein